MTKTEDAPLIFGENPNDSEFHPSGHTELGEARFYNSDDGVFSKEEMGTLEATSDSSNSVAMTDDNSDRSTTPPSVKDDIDIDFDPEGDDSLSYWPPELFSRDEELSPPPSQQDRSESAAAGGVENSYLSTTYRARFDESLTPGTENGMDQKPAAVDDHGSAYPPVAHQTCFGEYSTPGTETGITGTPTAVWGDRNVYPVTNHAGFGESTMPGTENDMDRKPAALKGNGLFAHQACFGKSPTLGAENGLNQPFAAVGGAVIAFPPVTQQESIETPTNFTSQQIKEMTDVLFFVQNKQHNKKNKKWRTSVKTRSRIRTQPFTVAVANEIYNELIFAGMKKVCARTRGNKQLWNEVGFDVFLKKTRERWNQERKPKEANRPDDTIGQATAAEATQAPTVAAQAPKIEAEPAHATMGGSEGAQTGTGVAVGTPPASERREYFFTVPERSMCLGMQRHPGYIHFCKVVKRFANNRTLYKHWNDDILKQIIKTLKKDHYYDFLVFRTEDNQETTSIHDGLWVRASPQEIREAASQFFHSHRALLKVASTNHSEASTDQQPPPDRGGSGPDENHPQGDNHSNMGGYGSAPGATQPGNTSGNGGGDCRHYSCDTSHIKQNQMDLDDDYDDISSSDDEMDDDDSDEEPSDASNDGTSESEDDESDGEDDDDDDDDDSDPSSKQDNKVAATQRSPDVAQEVQVHAAAYRDKHALTTSESDSSCSGESLNTTASRKRQKLEVAHRTAGDISAVIDVEQPCLDESAIDKAKNSGEQTKLTQHGHNMSRLSNKVAQIQVKDHSLAVSDPDIEVKPEQVVFVADELTPSITNTVGHTEFSTRKPLMHYHLKSSKPRPVFFEHPVQDGSVSESGMKVSERANSGVLEWLSLFTDKKVAPVLVSKVYDDVHMSTDHTSRSGDMNHADLVAKYLESSGPSPYSLEDPNWGAIVTPVGRSGQNYKSRLLAHNKVATVHVHDDMNLADLLGLESSGPSPYSLEDPNCGAIVTPVERSGQNYKSRLLTHNKVAPVYVSKVYDDVQLTADHIWRIDEMNLEDLVAQHLASSDPPPFYLKHQIWVPHLSQPSHMGHETELNTTELAGPVEQSRQHNKSRRLADIKVASVDVSEGNDDVHMTADHTSKDDISFSETGDDDSDKEHSGAVFCITKKRFRDCDKSRDRMLSKAKQSATRMIRNPTYSIMANCVFIGWHSPATVKWLKIVKACADDEQRFPEWSEAIADQIRCRLAHDNIGTFVICLDDDGNPCKDVKRSHFLELLDSDIVEATRLAFLMRRNKLSGRIPDNDSPQTEQFRQGDAPFMKEIQALRGASATEVAGSDVLSHSSSTLVNQEDGHVITDVKKSSSTTGIMRKPIVSVTGIMRKPIRYIRAKCVCIGWLYHPTTVKWLEIVKAFAEDEQSYPEWTDDIVDEIKYRLAQDNMGPFSVYLDDKGKPCESLGGRWFEAVDSEIVEATRLAFTELRGRLGNDGLGAERLQQGDGAPFMKEMQAAKGASATKVEESHTAGFTAWSHSSSTSVNPKDGHVFTDVKKASSTTPAHDTETKIP